MFTYTQQVLGSLMMLSMVFVMIAISRASCERIVEILDEESDIVSPADAVTEVPDGRAFPSDSLRPGALRNSHAAVPSSFPAGVSPVPNAASPASFLRLSSACYFCLTQNSLSQNCLL